MFLQVSQTTDDDENECGQKYFFIVHSKIDFDFIYNEVRQKLGAPINILLINLATDDRKMDKQNRVLLCIGNGSEFI